MSMNVISVVLLQTAGSRKPNQPLVYDLCLHAVQSVRCIIIRNKLHELLIKYLILLNI